MCGSMCTAACLPCSHHMTTRGTCLTPQVGYISYLGLCVFKNEGATEHGALCCAVVVTAECSVAGGIYSSSCQRTMLCCSRGRGLMKQQVPRCIDNNKEPWSSAVQQQTLSYL
jgi:hypothetical protein